MKKKIVPTVAAVAGFFILIAMPVFAQTGGTGSSGSGTGTGPGMGTGQEMSPGMSPDTGMGMSPGTSPGMSPETGTGMSPGRSPGTGTYGTTPGRSPSSPGAPGSDTTITPGEKDTYPRTSPGIEPQSNRDVRSPRVAQSTDTYRTSPGVTAPDTRVPSNEGVAPREGITENEERGTFPGRGEGISPGPGLLPAQPGESHERARDIGPSGRSTEMDRTYDRNYDRSRDMDRSYDRSRAVNEMSPRAVPPAKNPVYYK